MYTHITFDPEILGGKPILAGTRISVEFIMELVASGATIDDIVKEYPQCAREAVSEAIVYAANAVKNEVLITSRVTA